MQDEPTEGGDGVPRLPGAEPGTFLPPRGRHPRFPQPLRRPLQPAAAHQGDVHLIYQV